MLLVYSSAALAIIFESIPRTNVKLSVWRILKFKCKSQTKKFRARSRKTAADILSGSLFSSNNGLVSVSTSPVR